MKPHRIETLDSVILLVPIEGGGGRDCLLTVSDREYISGLSSPKRRREVASWRSAVRAEGISGDIVYAETGAPQLSGHDRWTHIGVSHTDGMAAVVLSKKPCAIDVECAGRNFRRTSPKFISPEEENIPGSDNPLFPAALWCAKEALYKFSGRKGMDLRKDLRVYSVNFDSGTISGAMLERSGGSRECAMKMLLHDNYLVVYLIG